MWVIRTPPGFFPYRENIAPVMSSSTGGRGVLGNGIRRISYTCVRFCVRGAYRWNLGRWKKPCASSKESPPRRRRWKAFSAE